MNASWLIVSDIEISVLAHITEDISKVKMAVKNVLPEILGETYSFKIESLKGHYGNPIRLMKLRIIDKEHQALFFKELIDGLRDEDLAEVSKKMEHHLDVKGAFFLRLDKQAAFMGRLECGVGDPIKVRVSIKSWLNREMLVEELRRRFQRR